MQSEIAWLEIAESTVFIAFLFFTTQHFCSLFWTYLWRKFWDLARYLVENSKCAARWDRFMHQVAEYWYPVNRNARKGP